MPPDSPAGGSQLIRVTDLRKSFGSTIAVDGISFGVERGEILGFLGPNGAGKSTTLKVITGYLVPDGGNVQVAGIDVSTDPLEARRRLGYLPESLPLYWEMLVDEYLNFIAQSRGLDRKRRKERVDEVIQLLGLQRMRKRPTGSLSKGFRQRVGLAQALIHDPEILILDEPTNGLDPQQIVEIRDLIRRLAANKGIIFSTHIIQEIAAICSRIMIIRDGRLIAHGTPAELAERAAAASWEVVIDGQDSIAEPQLETFGLGRVSGRRRLPNGYLYRFTGGDGNPDLAGIARTVADSSCRLIEVRRPQSSLEEIYMTLTAGKGVA